MSGDAEVRRAAQLEVWQYRLAGVCTEAGESLRRGASSPNIKEREDFSCALFTPSGEMVAQAEHIPVHLGSMPASVAAALGAFDDLAPGDQVVLNDPFRGGTHLNDVTFVTPVHDADGALIGYAANRAHHADVGGAAPGSLSVTVPDSVAEGLTIPPVRAVRGGHWDPDVLAIVLANTRTAAERAGDLDAQAGANRLAARRLADLAARHGSDALLVAQDDVLAYAERRMRAALADAADSVPESGLEFSDVLEAVDGTDATIHVVITIDERGLHADFSGTDTARPGVPCAVASVTRSCVEYVARLVTDPTIPRNGGASRLLHLDAPEGSIVAATFPTPVGAGNVETSQRVVDVLLGALAPAFPERVGAASQGTMNNVLIGGHGFVYYETIGGGQGGRPHAEGQSAIQTHMTNTANTPIEALETEFPMRVTEYSVRRGSGGAGEHPGGDGIVRGIELLEPATVSLLAERRRHGPWGLGGGEAGEPGRDTVIVDGEESELAAKSTAHFPAGTRITVRTPGGGGWGPVASAP